MQTGSRPRFPFKCCYKQYDRGAQGWGDFHRSERYTKDVSQSQLTHLPTGTKRLPGAFESESEALAATGFSNVTVCTCTRVPPVAVTIVIGGACIIIHRGR